MQHDIAILGREKDTSKSTYKEKHPVGLRVGNRSGCLERSSCRTNGKKLVGTWVKYTAKNVESNSAARVMIQAQMF